ncbi:hypothetical protein RDWZM_003010 [Blomia tropicalis]|uniref:Uncharacterized protein n=1 Tax=Blomia tropicalis TaxID=40697 RepID=A0A9Q0MIS1_BLOTA|nr:hypothetical protein RDWZM_003010 [Blomia tropicalis]
MIIYLLFQLSFVEYSSSGITILYDDASKCNYRYQYIVRLLYGKMSTSYQENVTTIYVELEHSINRVVKIRFTPNSMSRLTPLYKGFRVAKIFIRSYHPYIDVRNSILYHDGYGSIFIYSVELQDVDKPNTIISYIRSPIFGLKNKRNHHLCNFPFGQEETNPLEDDILPTQNVSLVEMGNFSYIAINAIYLSALLWMECYCTDVIHPCTANISLLIGLYAGLIGFVIFLVIIIIFRYTIKHYYRSRMGRGCSQVILILYQTLMILIGFSAAFYCSYRSLYGKYLNINRKSKEWSPWIVWSVIVTFGVFIYFIMIVISIPVAIFLRFITILEHDNTFWGKLPVFGRAKNGFPLRRNVTLKKMKYKSKDAWNEAKNSSTNNYNNNNNETYNDDTNVVDTSLSSTSNVAIDGVYVRALNKSQVVRSISQFDDKHHYLISKKTNFKKT